MLLCNIEMWCEVINMVEKYKGEEIGKQLEKTFVEHKYDNEFKTRLDATMKVFNNCEFVNDCEHCGLQYWEKATTKLEREAYEKHAIEEANGCEIEHIKCHHCGYVRIVIKDNVDIPVDW